MRTTLRAGVVIGLGYGDEGKGQCVDHLTRELGAHASLIAASVEREKTWSALNWFTAMGDVMERVYTRYT